MRALFEDSFYAGVDPSHGISRRSGSTPPEFVIHKVVWADDPKIDLYFRVDKLGGGEPITIYAYRTLALARAHDTGAPTGYVASAQITTGDLPDTFDAMTSLALTDNPAVAPTISASIQVYGAEGSPGTISGIMGYTASPDLYACDAIVAVLQEYTGTGYVLEDFATTNIAVGDPGAARALPHISVRTTDFEFLEQSTGSLYALSYALEIRVQTVRLDTGDQAGPRENAWRTCRMYQAAVESILMDERRTLDKTVFILSALDGSAPEPTEDSLLYSATVAVGAEFWVVWPEND